jgi:hypothetical protein
MREAIESGKINEAIQLLNSLYPEIIDNNRLLAFHLQVFRKIYDAIKIYMKLIFSNKNLLSSYELDALKTH